MKKRMSSHAKEIATANAKYEKEQDKIAHEREKTLPETFHFGIAKVTKNG